MNSLFWRRPGLAGPAFVKQALAAFVFAGLMLSSQLLTASADDAVTTVHIRGGAEGAPADDTGSASAFSEEFGMFEVGERSPAVSTSTSIGNAIVLFAVGYVGYPYAWAGDTPAGFDCSGFTQFVVLNTLGINIGHAIEGQPGAGAWVEWGTWQPGDLVFFQNTYRAGLSHVGIYIGEGLFVHAENEGTGVLVSSMYSDYYGPRYWGAVRTG